MSKARSKLESYLPPSPSPGAAKRQFSPSKLLEYTFLKSSLK